MWSPDLAPPSVYPVVFVDAIMVKVRDGNVVNRPIYLAMGVTVDGERDILGLWAGEHGDGEGAKFWQRVLAELKNRGVRDVLMLVCDGLKGLPDSVNAVWDRTIVQTSSIHNGQAEIVSVVTRTVPGRTCANVSPSRSRCRPVRPGRRRASHLPAGAAPRAPRWGSDEAGQHAVAEPREGAILVHSNDSTTPDDVFVGIDWGGSFHQLCLLDAAGRVQIQRRISHDLSGLVQLGQILNSQPGYVRVAIERSEGILVERLHTWNLPVYCISPKISARARVRYRLSATKFDTFDAYVLADTLRHEHRHWRPLSPPSPLLAELRAISRDRQRVLYAQQACESRLRAVLDAYHPAPLHLFSTLDRDIRLNFITDYPTSEQASRVATARMEAFCRRHGYSGRTTPGVLVDQMRPHLLAAGEGTTAGKSFGAKLFVDQLRMLNAHLRAYDKRMSELLDAHPDTPIFTSFPGVGPIVTAILISEMGEDRTRFPGCLQPAAGQAGAGCRPR